METLSATIFVKKIPILSPLLNIIHTGMDENQQQSKVNKSANEVVKLHCKHFLDKLCTSYKKVCVVLNFCPWCKIVLNFCPWCKNQFPLALLMI